MLNKNQTQSIVICGAILLSGIIGGVVSRCLYSRPTVKQAANTESIPAQTENAPTAPLNPTQSPNSTESTNKSDEKAAVTQYLERVRQIEMAKLQLPRPQHELPRTPDPQSSLGPDGTTENSSVSISDQFTYAKQSLTAGHQEWNSLLVSFDGIEIPDSCSSFASAYRYYICARINAIERLLYVLNDADLNDGKSMHLARQKMYELRHDEETVKQWVSKVNTELTNLTTK